MPKPPKGPSHHAVTDREPERGRGRAEEGLGGQSARSCRERGRRRQGGGGGGARMIAEERRARLQLLATNHTLLDEKPADAVEPALVVAGVQVASGLHALDGMPKLVDVVEGPQACALDGDHHRFPLRVKGGLVRLTLYRTEAVHASEIVYAV